MGHIVARGVGKAYKRYASRFGQLLEWLDPDERQFHEKRWVLRDVSFEVRPGESVGIIGHNGAGKSTLLKIITGTTRPTIGSVETGGRVAALLELGMGFHPEFTGRQNAWMSAQLLGLSPGEITACMPEIVEFADIGDYIDQPIRTYSSGMQGRLGFAVATAVRPEVLIVDEALSVGDVFFQQRCYDRIRGFAAQGTTLLFVSHSLGTVLELCDRALLLKAGALVHDGDPKAAIDLYQADLIVRRDRSREHLRVEQPPRPSPVSVSEDEVGSASASASVGADPGSISTDAVRIESVCLLDPDERVLSSIITGEHVQLRISVQSRRDLRDPHVGFKIRNAMGVVIYETNSYCLRERIGASSVGDRIEVRFGFALPIAPGEYTITVGVANEAAGDGDFAESLHYEHGLCAFSVLPHATGDRWSGVIDLAPRFESKVQRS